MLKKLSILGGAIAGFLAVAGPSFAAPPVADPTAAAALSDVTSGMQSTYFSAWVVVLGVIGAIIVTGLFIRFILRKVKGAASH